MAGWLVLTGFAIVSGAFAAPPDAIERIHVERGSMQWGPCKSCEWSVRSIQDFIADPAHQELMAEAIDSVACSFQTPTSKEFCKHNVQAVLKHAVHLVEDYVSPRSVCQSVCGWGRSGFKETPPKVGSAYPQCPYCNFAVQQSHDAKEADVMGALQAASKALPSSFANQYERFVQVYGQNVAKLVEVAGPAHACIEAAHCEVPGLGEAISSIPAPEELSKAVAELAATIGQAHISAMCNPVLGTGVSGSEECDFCKMAVLEIRDKISDPVFQSNVEKYLRTICAKLGDYKGMCVQYVDEYLPIAFALTEEYLQPERACQMVHLCPH